MDTSKNQNRPDTEEVQAKPELNRRDMLRKYGAYTAPLVVSMLVPEQAYAMNGMTPYSTIGTCQANHMGRQAMNTHCANRHPIG